MVERLAELLRRIDLVLDGAVRGLLDRSAPIFQCLLQRMARRHPVRELELEAAVLSGGAASGECGHERGRANMREIANVHGVLPEGAAGFLCPAFASFSRMSSTL